MNDIESTVRTRLHHLTDDLPDSDPMLRVQAAKSLYRRRRRTRLGVVAVAAAVAAIVSAPTALGSLTAAPTPAGGQAAAPGTDSAEPTATAAAEAAARLAALAAAQQAAALDEASRARGEADLAADAERSQGFGSAMHECLSGLGIDSDVLGNGGLALPEPPGPDNDYGAALADCQTRTGYGAITRLSDDAYRVLYSDYLDVSRCLVTHGFTPAAPGDREEFVTSGGRSWQPFAGLPPGAMASAPTTCPLPTY